MELSSVSANQKNLGVCIIKELRITTAAVNAVERLSEKQRSGQELNEEERKALADYYAGIAELVIRAAKNMSMTHYK